MIYRVVLPGSTCAVMPEQAASRHSGCACAPRRALCRPAGTTNPHAPKIFVASIAWTRSPQDTVGLNQRVTWSDSRTSGLGLAGKRTPPLLFKSHPQFFKVWKLTAIQASQQKPGLGPSLTGLKIASPLRRCPSPGLHFWPLDAWLVGSYCCHIVRKLPGASLSRA